MASAFYGLILEIMHHVEYFTTGIDPFFFRDHPLIFTRDFAFPALLFSKTFL